MNYYIQKISTIKKPLIYLSLFLICILNTSFLGLNSKEENKSDLSRSMEVFKYETINLNYRNDNKEFLDIDLLSLESEAPGTRLDLYSGVQNFPDSYVGKTVIKTFVIRNQDTEALTLPDGVVILGSYNADFSVTKQPATSVAAGDYTTFDISFTPSTDNNIAYTTDNPTTYFQFPNNNLDVDLLYGIGATIVANRIPIGTDVAFSGTLEIGVQLSGSYTYIDADNEAESGTTYKWYTSDDAAGTNKAAIAGATAQTFVLTSTQLGKFISFQVTPNDGVTAGAAVESSRQGTVKTDQTITFNALAAKTYGDATFNLAATTSSNLTVTYTSSNTNVATIAGSTVTIVGAGSTNITASQAGDASYKAATNQIQSLTVNKATLTATADDKSRGYGDANPTLAISYTGFKNSETSAVIDTEPTTSTTASTTSNVGTADITLAGGSDGNYDFTLNKGTLTISKATLVATADNKSRGYGDANSTFTISYTGYKNSETATVIDTEPSVSTAATSTTAVGTAPITLSGGSDGNYDFTLNNGTLTINKATLTATADDKSRTYGEANPALTISYTGFKNGETATVINTAPTASTTATATTNVGTASITLAGGTDDNYSLNLVNGSLTIGKATLTATAADKNRAYGEANSSLTIDYTGFKNGETKTVIDTEPTVSTTATTTTNAGTASITLTGGSDNNYDLSLNGGTLTINKAVLVATADNKSRGYGDANPTFTINYTGFKNSETATVIDTEPTASTTATTTTNVGTANITLSGGNDNNYSFGTLNNGALTITKAVITATADDKSRVYGDSNPALTISYTGFKNGETATVINTAPTASTTATATTNVGTASITVAGGTDDNYSLNLVNGSLTIGKATLTTTTDDKSRDYGDTNPTFTINYTSFKNGESSAVIDTEPTASTTATATTNVGTATITLAGGTDDNYDFNLNSGTLTISKATLTATADDKSRVYGDASPTFTISYTGFKNSETSAVIDTAPTASTTATTTTNVGTANITLAGGSDGNYDFTLNNGTLTINKATLTATADDKSRTYGEANPALTISYTGFKNGETATVINTVPTASTTATTTTNVGTASITLAGGTDDNYSLNLVNGSLTIGKATLTATAADKNRVYGEANPALNVNYTGFKNGETKTMIDTEPTVSTTATTTTNAGTASITLTGGSDNNYDLSLNVGTLTISKATLVATADNKSRGYGDANSTFTISYTGFKNSETARVIDTEPTASTTATAATNVGAVSITLSGGSDNNYSFGTLNNGTLTITKAVITATADDKSKNEGTSNPALTLSFSGFVNGEGESVLDQKPSVSTSVNIGTASGTYPIMLTGGSDNNYTFNLIDGVFTVLPGAVITQVSVPTDGLYKIGDNLDFTVNYSNNITITGTTTIPLTIGSSTVSATQVGTVINSNTIIFRYTVLEGNVDTDGISVGSTISLNGGMIKDQFGVDAILTLNSIATSTAVLVDGVRPIPTLSTAGSNLINTTFTTTFEYAEAVIGFTLADISVTNGRADNLTEVTSGTKWTADIVPTTDGVVNVSLAADVVLDSPGNTSAASNTVSKTFDGTAPTVSSISRKDADQLNGATTSAEFRVVFSEDVTGVNATDFEVVLTSSATGTFNTITQVDNKTYDVNVNGISGEGTIGLNAKDDDSIVDAAGNSLGGTFTGQVYTTNFVSTDITIFSSVIAENNAVGDVVGTLSSTDSDTEDTHTYSLVSGTGDSDNTSFSITGSSLKAEEVFDFEIKNSYSIRVKTNDGKGGVFEKVLSIAIENVLEPSVIITGDASFTASALGLSQQLPLTLTNNGEVSVEVRVVSTPAGFSVLPGSLILGVGATTEVSLTFIPTEARTYDGNITFSYGDFMLSHPVLGEGAIITSVDDNLISSEEILLYPNPATTLLNIDFSELNGKKLDIVMMNSSGIAVYQKRSYSENRLRLNVQKFDTGLYIMQFTDGVSVVRKKIMIKK